MLHIYCALAINGVFAVPFLNGGYTSIGWLEGINLAYPKMKNEIYGPSGSPLA